MFIVPFVNGKVNIQKEKPEDNLRGPMSQTNHTSRMLRSGALTIVMLGVLAVVYVGAAGPTLYWQPASRFAIGRARAGGRAWRIANAVRGHVGRRRVSQHGSLRDVGRGDGWPRTAGVHQGRAGITEALNSG